MNSIGLATAVLATITAFCVAAVIAFRRRRSAVSRLALLGRIGAPLEPGMRPDETMTEALRRLCEFFAAQNCIAVFATASAPQVVDAEGRAEALPAPALRLLLDLPDACIATWRRQRLGGPRIAVLAVGEEIGEHDRVRAATCADELAAHLPCPAWILVPIVVHGAFVGRLCLLGPRRAANAEDLALLLQAAAVLASQAAALRRLDDLAADAARRERSRISLDLHDSTIQPYLGLKLGLEALARKLAPDNPAAADLRELCRMTQDSIDELRGYVRVLDGRPPQRKTPLREGLYRQARRFGHLYGIEVAMNLPNDMELDEPLTDGVLQMIGESLSNIGRHTVSRQVTINLAAGDGRLRAEVVNQGTGGGDAWCAFRPVSLQRRALALGGGVEVTPRPGGGSAVTMTLPLRAQA